MDKDFLYLLAGIIIGNLLPAEDSLKAAIDDPSRRPWLIRVSCIAGAILILLWIVAREEVVVV